jgi:HlyD family secretion protein
MKWPFRVIALLVGIALALGIVRSMRPAPVDVDVAAVARGPLDQKVISDGRARVRERYTVSAPVAGALGRIDLNEGDPVEPGMVLARLLPLPSPLLDPRAHEVAQQRLAAAVDSQKQSAASVARADAAADQARRELARVQALAATGTLPGAQLDDVTAEVHIREAELSAARFSQQGAEHDVEQARAALERFAPGAGPPESFDVTCPVHGRVLHVLQKSARAVEAGTPLIEVGDPRALELVVDVLSQDAVAVRPGQPAAIVHWGGEAALRAKVRHVEPSAFTKTSALGVDEQRVNVVLDPDGPADDWGKLGDGFAAEIEVTVWSRPDVVKVPTSALFRADDGMAVFVVQDGRAVVRAVGAAHRGALETEIERGLAPGEIVVIHPGPSVRAGERVAFR